MKERDQRPAPPITIRHEDLVNALSAWLKAMQGKVVPRWVFRAAAVDKNGEPTGEEVAVHLELGATALDGAVRVHRFVVPRSPVVPEPQP